ncbi:spermidine resistance protein [Sorochytrium milnesiophthora]
MSEPRWIDTLSASLGESAAVNDLLATLLIALTHSKHALLVVQEQRQVASGLALLDKICHQLFAISPSFVDARSVRDRAQFVSSMFFGDQRGHSTPVDELSHRTSHLTLKSYTSKGRHSHLTPVTTARHSADDSLHSARPARTDSRDDSRDDSSDEEEHSRRGTGGRQGSTISASMRAQTAASARRHRLSGKRVSNFIVINNMQDLDSALQETLLEIMNEKRLNVGNSVFNAPKLFVIVGVVHFEQLHGQSLRFRLHHDLKLYIRNLVTHIRCCNDELGASSLTTCGCCCDKYSGEVVGATLRAAQETEEAVRGLCVLYGRAYATPESVQWALDKALTHRLFVVVRDKLAGHDCGYESGRTGAHGQCYGCCGVGKSAIAIDRRSSSMEPISPGLHRPAIGGSSCGPDVYSVAQRAIELAVAQVSGPEKLLEIWFHPLTAGRANYAYAEAAQVSTPALSSDDEASVRLARKRRKTDPIQDSKNSDGRCASDNHDDNDDDINYDDDATDTGAVIEKPTSSASPFQEGLRKVERKTWQDMLDLVKCQILSVASNEYMDAYLLSESSLFVYPQRVILKTCGTTTLLLALPRILEIAQHMCGFKAVDKVFYSRKSYLFPEKQQWPHQSWDAEVKCLDDMFGAVVENGSAYVLGKTNGDHWHLYVAGEQLLPGVEETHHLPLIDRVNGTITPGAATPTCFGPPRALPPKLATAKGTDPPDLQELLARLAADEDQTLEIMMTELDPEMMSKFYCKDGDAGGSINNIEEITKLAAVYEPICPDIIADSYLFQPCGWSVNGLATSMGPYYWTIHVTPENTCSYASFETNIPVWKSHPASRFAEDAVQMPASPDSLKAATAPASPAVSDMSFTSEERKAHNAITSSYLALINQVVDIFRPGKFSITLFRSKHTISSLDEDHFADHADNLLSAVHPPMTHALDRVPGEPTYSTLAPPRPAGSDKHCDGATTTPERCRHGRRAHHRRQALTKSAVEGYIRVDKIVHEFEDYELLFCHYTRI